MKKKFDYGKIYLTRGVNDLVADDNGFAKFVLLSLRRHISGDWGEMSEEDKQANERSVVDGRLRIFSSYNTGRLRKIWIITEADRSATTILFPEEY
jgi:hypothetical protein